MGASYIPRQLNTGMLSTPQWQVDKDTRASSSFMFKLSLKLQVITAIASSLEARPFRTHNHATPSPSPCSKQLNPSFS